MALEMAARSAGPSGKVFVVVCFDEPPAWAGKPVGDAALEKAQSAARQLISELEDGAIPALDSTQWEHELLAGPPADAILRVADVRAADEIFIGSRGRGRSAALLGSVSQAVLHLTDRPVRVITMRAAERLSTFTAAAG